MLRERHLKRWIGCIVLGVIIVGTAYLLIPKNLGRLLAKDADYYISINEMYYSEEQNIICPRAYAIDITDESYTGLIELFGKYSYYGFWHSLWGRNTSNTDVYYISNDSDKGFMIDKRGRFCLTRNNKLYTYHLGGVGPDEEIQLYEAIKKLLEEK